jgi:hypothetical protein
MLDSSDICVRSTLLDEHLYEVHVTNSEAADWQRTSGFDNLEDARIEAVHLIRDTDIHSVRIMHVVEYYRKSAEQQAR